MGRKEHQMNTALTVLHAQLDSIYTYWEHHHPGAIPRTYLDSINTLIDDIEEEQL